MKISTILLILSRFRIFVVMVFAIIFLQSCYYITQGYYLFNHTYSATNIKKILADPTTNEHTILFLQQIEDIQHYAKNIGLAHNKKYRSYKVLDKDYLVAVVQAAEKLSVEPYKWSYPFLGKLPYKGYYNEDEAIKESNRLLHKGYETYVRKVSAFSTLKILPDPVYSFMMNYDEHNLAETLFHEQMHATIWIKKQDAFNEQLSTFVGRQVMLQYMKEKYGKDSETFKNIEIQEQDSSAWRTLLLDTKNQLEQLYANNSLTDEQKIITKKTILQQQQQNLLANYDTLFQTDTYRKVRIDQLNNAFFALISTYENSQNEFIDAFRRCNNDIRVFLTQVKKILTNKSYQENPYKFIKTIEIN